MRIERWNPRNRHKCRHENKKKDCEYCEVEREEGIDEVEEK